MPELGPLRAPARGKPAHYRAMALNRWASSGATLALLMLGTRWVKGMSIMRFSRTARSFESTGSVVSNWRLRQGTPETGRHLNIRTTARELARQGLIGFVVVSECRG